MIRVLVPLLLSGCVSTPQSEFDPRWKKVWADEFDGAAGPIDSASWNHDVGGDGWGNAQLEYDTDRTENSRVDGNGNLVITAINEDFEGNTWTSARLTTAGKVEHGYGRYEARIQFPAGRGLWPAFWMLGADFPEVGWPLCGEIDIVELKGETPEDVITTIHGPGFSGGESVGATTGFDTPVTDGFHVYAVELDPEHISWYFDDQLVHRAHPGNLPPNSGWVFDDKDFFVILNLAVGGKLPRPARRVHAVPRRDEGRLGPHLGAPEPMRGAALALALTACVAEREVPPSWLTVSQEQQAAWVRNFNPLVATEVRWATKAAMYEPLAIHDAVNGQWVPWLATSWTWDETATALEFELREDVLWSDGTPMDARDVVFSAEVLRQHPALDGAGLWRELATVEALDAHRVRFTFHRPYSPGLGLVALRPVVPEHVWRDIDDPVTFANPDPVATGPFTEVLRFGTQEFVLGKNARYWQVDAVAPEALRFPALPSNDAANLALITGELDWAGNFVPAVERTFVARDADHHGYWFPTAGAAVMLLPNHTRSPLDRTDVRRALSLSLDRSLIVDVAMYGYVPPAHPTGLPDGMERWRIDPENHHVYLDREQARRLLEQAGYGPGAQPLTLEIICPAGWSDWVRAGQVIARDLQAVGIDARLRTYDFSAWFERILRGDFDLALGWTEEGPTPHAMYRGLMSAREVKPVGEATARNWHRYGTPEADRLLAAMEQTPDPDAQRVHGHALQQLFVDEVPAIPLFPSPSWGEYSTRRFTGWPNADNPHARLSPNNPPETLLVLTRLEAR